MKKILKRRFKMKDFVESFESFEEVEEIVTAASIGSIKCCC